MAMPSDADWSWLRAAAEAPEMTLEVYESLPEDLARGIEVVDGQRLVWPLLADAFARLWDLPKPPSPGEVTQAFGAG